MNRRNCESKDSFVKNCNSQRAHIDEEFIAKAVTMCLLKKSYESSSLWSKWIILSALDELFGKPAPFLDEKSLHYLQENKSAESLNNNMPNSDLIPVVKDTQNIEDIGNANMVSDNLNNITDSFFVSHVTENKNKINSQEINYVDQYLNQMVHSLEENINRENNIKNVKTNFKEYTEPIKLSISTQTNNIFCNDKSVQTEFEKTANEINMDWKLIEITFSNIDFMTYINSLKKDYKRKSKESPIKLFHGRPLIGSKSKLAPAVIPLDPILPDFILTDPRIGSKKWNSHFGYPKEDSIYVASPMALYGSSDEDNIDKFHIQ